MDKQAIDNVICEILYQDGPDRHIDGHEVISEFIDAIINGQGSDWADAYAKKHIGRTRFI